MTSTADEAKAEAAKTALVSDIRELKEKSGEMVAKASSHLPWLIGGAFGLLTVAVLLASRSRPRSFLPPRRSVLSKVARAAAISAVGIVTRRLVTRSIDAVLPELESERAASQALTEPRAEPEVG